MRVGLGELAAFQRFGRRLPQTLDLRIVVGELVQPVGQRFELGGLGPQPLANLACVERGGRLTHIGENRAKRIERNAFQLCDAAQQQQLVVLFGERVEFPVRVLHTLPGRGRVLGYPWQKFEIPDRAFAQHLQRIEPFNQVIQFPVEPAHGIERRLPDVATELVHPGRELRDDQVPVLTLRRDVKGLAGFRVFLRVLDNLGEGRKHEFTERALRSAAMSRQAVLRDLLIDRGYLAHLPAGERCECLGEPSCHARADPGMLSGGHQLRHAPDHGLHVSVNRGDAGVRSPVERLVASSDKDILDRGVKCGKVREGTAPLVSRRPCGALFQHFLRRLDPCKPRRTNEVMIGGYGFERVAVSEAFKPFLLEVVRAKSHGRTRQAARNRFQQFPQPIHASPRAAGG